MSGYCNSQIFVLKYKHHPTHPRAAAEDRLMTKDTSARTDISIAVIFVGMQGAGKTEFYSRYFADAYQRIALSEIGTRQAERAIIRECISDRTSYVLDSQNLTREDRRRYFSKAKEAGYRIIGYYFDTIVTVVKSNGYTAFSLNGSCFCQNVLDDGFKLFCIYKDNIHSCCQR